MTNSSPQNDLGSLPVVQCPAERVTAVEVLPPERKRTAVAPVNEYDDPAVTRETMGKIYEAYLTSKLTVRELSVEYGVPVRTIVDMIDRYGWAQRKAQLDLEELGKVDGRYRKFVAEKKQPVAERQLAVSDKLIELLDKLLTDAGKSEDGRVSATELRRIAEALKSAADVGARVVGLSDTPVHDAVKSLQQQKPLLVVIGGRPQDAQT